MYSLSVFFFGKKKVFAAKVLFGGIHMYFPTLDLFWGFHGEKSDGRILNCVLVGNIRLFASNSACK